MEKEMKRAIILDNYENPFKKGLKNDKSYMKVNGNNESCIDNLDFEIKIEDNIIVDMNFNGEACAISTSSASIMIKLLLNKTIKEALNIINNFENMIDEKTYNEEILKEANCYDEIYKQPARKKCALLPFVTIKRKIIEEYYEN